MFSLAALTPVISWILVNAATCMLLTVPFNRRFYLLPSILIPATVSFATTHHLNYISGLPELWGLGTLIGLIQYTSVLYIKRWTVRTSALGERSAKPTKIWLSRAWWIKLYRVALNPRLHRIPYKKVDFGPGAGTQVKSNAIHRPFDLTRVMWLLVKLSANSILDISVTGGPFRRIHVNEFAPAKKGFLRRSLQLFAYGSPDSVSIREIVIRTWFTLGSIWTPILLLDAMHAALAIVFIYILRMDTTNDWPDLFGSPLEAYTLGRFWSRFWHRLHLSGYTDYSKLFLNVLPRYVIRNAVIEKILMTFLLFLISGCIHQVTTWQLNSGCSDYADIQFFCLNAVAVILESALLGHIRSCSASQQEKHIVTNGVSAKRSVRIAFLRLLGYIWVVSFFFWIVPKIYYPRVYCMIKQQTV